MQKKFWSLISRTVVLVLAVSVFSGCSPAAKKARVLERADRYFKAGEYDKAKVEYMNVLRVDQQNARAFQQLGFIWFDQGVPLRAIPFLLKVRELSPQNIPARSKLALALMAVGDRSGARKEAMSVLKMDPANSDALILFADSAQTKEEIAAAEREFDKFPGKDTAAFHLGQASLMVKKGDIGAASDEVQQALNTDPKSARSHLVMAYMYLLRKNPSRAGPELKAAAELSPLRSEEQIKYAEFQAANGATSEARELLKKMTKMAPDYVPAWRALAMLSMAEKKYDEAFAFLENIFSRDPENPEGRIMQAQVWVAKGEPAKAIGVLEKLDKNYPGNALLKYQLARAYLLNKNPSKAMAALDQAIAAKPDYAEAILLLAEVNLRSGKAQPVVNAMEELRNKGVYIPQVRIFLATAYQLLGRLDDAASIFREQIQQTPQAPDAHFFLGVILRQEKKNAEARQEFEKALELKPDNWMAIDHLGEMDIADNQYAPAEQRVRAYLEKKPDQAPGHYMLGKIYAAQKSWPQAESELKKAIELDPNFGGAYNGLISIYVEQNKLPEAIAELESELKQRPGDGRSLLTLGFLYERAKEYAKARDVYEKVLVNSPDSVATLNNLACLYAQRFNRLDRAYELAQKARKLQPGDASIADSLGWILYQRRDYQQALPLLQESAGKLPDNAEVQFHLGMTAYMMGQADIARVALEKAAQSGVDFPGKDEARRRLASFKNGSLPQQQESSDLLALIRRGEALEKQGETAKAAEVYEQALTINPKLADVTLKLAQLYAGPLHNHDKAFEFAKKARALSPNDTKTVAVLGQVALQSDNYSWGYSLLQESVRQGTNDPAVLHDFAVAAYALGNVAEGRQTMQRVLELQPTPNQTQEAKTFLAMTALEQPSIEAVTKQQEIDMTLSKQPDYVPALMAKAAIQLQQNNRDAAAETYQKVLQKYPDFAPAQKRLAIVYAENPDKIGIAYDLAMKARKTLPDDADLALALAEITYQRKEFSYAMQLFQQAATKQSLPAKDLFYLGMAQLHSRQFVPGRETLDRALKAGLSGSPAEEAKKRLAEQQR